MRVIEIGAQTQIVVDGDDRVVAVSPHDPSQQITLSRAFAAQRFLAGLNSAGDFMMLSRQQHRQLRESQHEARKHARRIAKRKAQRAARKITRRSK